MDKNALFAVVMSLSLVANTCEAETVITPFSLVAVKGVAAMCAFAACGPIGMQIGRAFVPQYSLPKVSPNIVRSLAAAAFYVPTTLNSILPLRLAAVLVCPVTEELMFRGLIQNAILTRVPELVFDKPLVHHPIVAVSRILFTSWLFAIGHWQSNYDQVNPSSLDRASFADRYVHAMITGGTYPQLLLGILLGTIQETTESLYAGILWHAWVNVRGI